MFELYLLHRYTHHEPVHGCPWCEPRAVIRSVSLRPRGAR